MITDDTNLRFNNERASKRPRRDSHREGPRVVGSSPKSSYKPREEEEEEKGTVLTCTKCQFAFFSRWEAPEGFGEEPKPDETLSEKALRIMLNEVPKEHQVCERCLADRIFKKNMAILSKAN